MQLSPWAEQARQIIAEFAGELDKQIAVNVTFDQTRYTLTRLNDLSNNMIAGAVIVTLVVLIFMGWRSALIVGSALPLSAAASLFGLSLLGGQIHQMSIFGMIIAIGLLIDNAIVMTDEVRRQVSQGMQGQVAMAAAIKHLFKPLFASTLTTILAFMPIFLLSGNVGDFVSSIATSVVLALIASFIIGMTIIPALAAHFLRPKSDQNIDQWWKNGIHLPSLQHRYRNLMVYALQRPLRTLFLVTLLPMLGFTLSSTLGQQFFPAADRDQFEIQLWFPSGASLNHTTDTAKAIEKQVRQHQGIQSVTWLVGGSTPSVYYNLIMDEDRNSAYAQSIVIANSVEQANRLIPKLQTGLDANFPEAQIIVGKFGQGPPVDAPVGFRITGSNPDYLRLYGEQVRRVMHKLTSIIHTQATIKGGEAKLWFDVDEDEARMAGFSLNDISSQLQYN